MWAIKIQSGHVSQDVLPAEALRNGTLAVGDGLGLLSQAVLNVVLVEDADLAGKDVIAAARLASLLKMTLF